LRAHRAILAVTLGTLGLLLSGCGEEASPPKPTGTVVQKKIQKPEETTKPPAGQKPAQEKTSGTQEAPKQTQPPKAPDAVGESSLEEAKAETEVVYKYDPGDRPDPFRPFYEEAKAAASTSECEELSPGPLTEQEVSQFLLVAVVGQGADRVAMVQDRSGKGYLIKPGLHMGRKCGKVAEISPAEGVVVEEPYVDLLGQKQTRRVILGFKKSQGGGR
jgi:type IV pilus assembly protein PilP